MEKLTLEQIEHRLTYGIEKIFSSSQWQTYLKFVNSFHTYSYHNCVLIYSQRPNATFVAGYQTWKTKYHRQVKQREKGIAILAPIEKYDTARKESIVIGFRSRYVFDISQTVGQEIPSIAPTLLTDKVQNYESIKCALEHISPVPIRYTNMKHNGTFSPKRNTIQISRSLPETQSIKTMLHEIAHALMHNLESDGFLKDRKQKEIEAESVAYIVSYHLGLNVENYTFPYIAGWSSNANTDDLKSCMHDIHKTAHQLMESIDAQFDSINQLSVDCDPTESIVQLPVSSSISSSL